MSMQTLLSATLVICARRGYTTVHVRKLQSYCSLRASEANPRPSNFMSATDFKQKDRSGNKFLLFPQLNYLCLQIAPEMISDGLKSQNFSWGHAPDTPGALSAFIPTYRTNRKLLPTGLTCTTVSVLPGAYERHKQREGA